MSDRDRYWKCKVCGEVSDDELCCPPPPKGLLAENKRLRDALKRIADHPHTNPPAVFIAENALKHNGRTKQEAK